MLKKIFLVINPSSCSFLGQRKWPRMFELLQASSVMFDYAMTEKTGDGITLAAKASRAGYDAIIAVGGDGTINEVISGLVLGDNSGDIQCLPHDTDTCPKFGVIYTGTSPDFCTFHGLSLEPNEVIPRILSGITREVDLCKITHRIEAEGSLVSRIFSCSANFGLGAMIARGANSGLRLKWGDGLGTFLSLLHSMLNYNPSNFTLKIDDVEQVFKGVHNIFIGKNPYIASGIKLQLDITSDDGKMYLVPLHGGSKSRLLARLPRVYTGSICKDFAPRFCKTIEILDGRKLNEVEYDGDPRGFLPAKIEILPKVLSLLGAA